MTPAPDSSDLNRFGYAQELFRAMGGFSNFAISFSIISILTGAVTLYGYGLEMGGPLEMTLGWPIASFFTLLLACSMAELCSAYPTSGAMYHWAAALGSPGLGWLVACLNIAGAISAQAGINFSCAQFIAPVLGIPATPVWLFALFAGITVQQGLLNQFGVRTLALVNNASAVLHAAGVLLIAGAILWFARLQPAGYLLMAESPSGRTPYAWAFCLGLLQAHWTYTGFDGSAHMAEETVDPRRHAPWGIVLSVAVSAVVGYVLLLPLTLSIQNLPAVLSAKDAAGQPVPAAVAVLQTALGPRAGIAMTALAAAAMWFCGMSSLASTSRTVYSLARDGGTPWHEAFSRVSPRWATPGPAIWAVVATSIGAMVWTAAVPIVTALSTVALYVAYVIPIALSIRRRHLWIHEAPWNLGRAGVWVNAASIVYTVFICLVLVSPPNDLARNTFVGLLLLLAALWFGLVRARFRGPEWATHAISQEAKP